MQYILCLGGLSALLGATPAAAQTDGTTLRLEKQMVERAGDYLLVDLTFDLSDIRLAANRSVTYTPLITRGDSTRALPPLIINGRDRQILYERTGRNTIDDNEFAVRRRNGKEQHFDYHARVPYATWMERSEMAMATDLCGCGWQALSSDRGNLFDIRLSREPLQPVLAYVNPPAETVKARAKEGSAFLDFPVGKTAIDPDYRGNAAELAKIRETVESVRGDKYATITEVYIKGYASPEGSYRSNAYLAEHRAQALSDYVKGLFHFDGARFTVDAEPEDWAGLEARVAASDLPEKERLLAVIRATEPTDPDRREAALKAIDGGVPYRRLLQEIYPALRHSDYAVKYTIRNFTVDEAKHLIYTDPKQLSLAEMFQVAQTLEPGSEAFREVFEIAVRMYPDDPISNLNAAASAIATGQTEKARRYLLKAPACPEKALAEAALLMREGKREEAQAALETLRNEPRVAKQAEANLEQLAH